MKGNQGGTEAKVEVSETGLEPVAVRRAAVDGVAVPTTPAVHPANAGLRATRIRYNIDGIPNGKGYDFGSFEQSAQKCSCWWWIRIPWTRLNPSARDELTGNSAGAKFRRAGISQSIYSVIQAEINGSYAGTESLFGALSEYCFEM
jgi:hypothetical protein